MWEKRCHRLSVALASWWYIPIYVILWAGFVKALHLVIGNISIQCVCLDTLAILKPGLQYCICTVCEWLFGVGTNVEYLLALASFPDSVFLLYLNCTHQDYSEHKCYVQCRTIYMYMLQKSHPEFCDAISFLLIDRAETCTTTTWSSWKWVWYWSSVHYTVS